MERYSLVVFNKNRKGGTLLNLSQNQEILRLEETPTRAEETTQDNDEDTIVVQTNSLEPQEDSDEDTIVVRPYRPRRNSGRQPEEPERIESAGEITTKR